MRTHENEIVDIKVIHKELAGTRAESLKLARAARGTGGLFVAMTAVSAAVTNILSTRIGASVYSRRNRSRPWHLANAIAQTLNRHQAKQEVPACARVSD